MSRESLLDDAIAKAKDAEDWQLVEWLRMARGGESAARWYSRKLQEAHRAERKILNENAKLRDDNSKLKRLVDDLYFDLLGEMPESMLEDSRLQMRELGIEVK